MAFLTVARWSRCLVTLAVSVFTFVPVRVFALRCVLLVSLGRRMVRWRRIWRHVLIVARALSFAFSTLPSRAFMTWQRRQSVFFTLRAKLLRWRATLGVLAVVRARRHVFLTLLMRRIIRWRLIRSSVLAVVFVWLNVWRILPNRLKNKKHVAYGVVHPRTVEPLCTPPGPCFTPKAGKI